MKNPAITKRTAAASRATANTSDWTSSGSARRSIESLRSRLTSTAMPYAAASARKAPAWYAAAITWLSRKRAQASAVSVAHATRATVSITRSIAGTIAWPWTPGSMTTSVNAMPTATVRISMRSSFWPVSNGDPNPVCRGPDSASAVTVVPIVPSRAYAPRRLGTSLPRGARVLNRWHCVKGHLAPSCAVGRDPPRRTAGADDRPVRIRRRCPAA